MAAVSRSALSVRAFAKINLVLRVLGRRPDGYHDVRTVLQSLALHDTLTFRRTRGPFRIECDDPRCPADRSNLVWQAAERVWRAGGRPGEPVGVRVTLEKRIPMQAGLGGGSSDAAAAIRGLSRFWRIDLSDGQEHEIAASLGADVSYFLEGGTVLGLDRGDRLFPLVDFPAMAVLLIVPPFGVSAPDAYAWWDASRSDPSAVSGFSRASRGESNSRWALIPAWLARDLVNDLEHPVTMHHRQIATLVRDLLRAGADYAAMSGSGSAAFGLFPSAIRARLAAQSIRTEEGCWCAVTRTLGRATFQRLARPKSVSASDLPQKVAIVYT